MSNGYLTIKEVAEKIGRSTQSILKWENDGLISPLRDDRGWRLFSEEDLEKLEEIKKAKREAMFSGQGKQSEEDEVSE